MLLKSIVLVLPIVLLLSSCGSPYKEVEKKLGIHEASENADRVDIIKFSLGEDMNFDGLHDGENFKYEVLKSITLSEEKFEELREIVADEAIFTDMANKCMFTPHHAIVYYKNNEYIGDLTLCFMCDQFQASTSSSYKYMSREVSDKIKAFFNDEGLEVLL